MTIALRSLFILTGLFNFYLITVWICVFNLYDSQQARMKHFSAFIPPVTLSTLTMVMVLFTFTAIMYVISSKEINRSLWKIFVIVQSAFLLLYIWQYL